MAVARRLAWLVILVLGVALFLLVMNTLIVTKNPNLVPSLILIGAAVVPAAFVAFLWGRRLSFGVSGTLLAITAFIGGVIGVVTAGVLEYDILKDLGTLPLLVVGFSEELAKLIFPALLLLPPARLLFADAQRRPAHGLVIGVASGAGFAALETMGYAFVVLLASQGSIGATVGVLLLRGLMSPAAHMAWTGLTAAALWWAAFRGWQPRAVLSFLGAFVVAVLLHTAWDSFGSTVVYVVSSVMGLGLLIFTARRLGREPEPSSHGRALRTSAVQAELAGKGDYPDQDGNAEAQVAGD
jgi:RsiW-degrading membrane proteinase PrsW (M82 family)